MGSETTTPEFPEGGILWRGWNEETLRIIAEKDKPLLLFVRDPDPFVWPFLRETLKQMPRNARLRELLHTQCVALFLKASALPSELRALGAGSRYHIAVLSPSGLTPLVTIDPTSGAPAQVVENVTAVLERILEHWI
jgi:hypothetical protein